MEPNSSITIPRLDGSTSVVCGLATTEQIGPCRELYASAFGRPLSTADRMESDRRLADQPLTRNNRMKLWCVYLRDEPARVVAACKTVPREFLIREAQQPTRVGGGYCIASVVTDSEYRGLGIAAYLLKVIAEWLDETGTDANMLYSSVGSYYVNKGWDLLPSLQSNLSAEFPTDAVKSKLPSTRLLMADELPVFSSRDVERLKASFDSAHVQEKDILVTPVPSSDIVSIQHAREDFVGSRVRPGTSPEGESRGSICETVDAWVYWYRDYRDHQLTIQRVSLPQDDEGQSMKAMATMLIDAAIEAKRSGLVRVLVWNPSETILGALQLLSDEAGAVFRLEHRERDMPSIRWRKADKAKTIKVHPNEFYGWH